MKSLYEFTMDKLIATQLLVAETIVKMDNLIKSNSSDLGELKEYYSHNSIEDFQKLWKVFDDINYPLMEAEIKDDDYFTSNLYEIIKQKHLSVMSVLRKVVLAELPKLAFLVSPFPDIPQSQRSSFTAHQHFRFTAMEEKLKTINIDAISKVKKMYKWQHKFHRQWETIEYYHKFIRETYYDMWPDITYELDFVRYKLMYETTISLFNYKIDACLYPNIRAIPLIGIPTFRMFDDTNDVHPFAIRSIAWSRFEVFCDGLRNSEIPEGDRRELLITVFLAHQMYSDGMSEEHGFDLQYDPYLADTAPGTQSYI